MIEIIPAIDIIDGKCVRLTQGDYNEVKSYSDNPVDMALRFVDAGCRRLHLVDLDGAKASHVVNYKTLENIATKTSLIVDFGGGVKTDKDLLIAMDCGASMVTGGSVAVKYPDRFIGWLGKYGSDVIILGADAKNRKIATSGWLNDSSLDIIDFISDYRKKGIKKVISTDIGLDGMLSGPSLELCKDIIEKVDGVYLIASGGISSMADVERLDELAVPEVIVGKAIYENRISLKELESYNLKRWN